LGKVGKQRKVFNFTGLSHKVDYRVYQNNINALEKAVKERVLFVKNDEGHFVELPPVTRNVFLSKIGNFEKEMKKRAHFATPMSGIAFAMSYQDRRRNVYLRVAERLKRYGFHPRYARIRAFTKLEKYRFDLKEPVPRLIQPRQPEFLGETGPYVKPVEHSIYKNTNSCFGYTIVYKGLNAQQRGRNAYKAWKRFAHPVAFALDAKRFDQHVTDAALQTDHNVHCHFYPGDKKIRRLFNYQRHNKCTATCPDGFVKYESFGNRCSGDSNTSSGNVIIMCALLYGFKESVNYQIEFFNDGDDVIVIVNMENCLETMTNIKSHMAEAGFDVQLDAPVKVFEEISFCQSQPVMTNDGTYMFVRDPRVAIAKDCVSLKPLDNEEVKMKWLQAVGKGGLSLTKGIPVYQSFYKMFIREAKGRKALTDPTLEGGFFRLSKGMSLADENITSDTRLSFWKAFGILPEEQICLETYYDKYVIGVGQESHRFAHLPLYGRTHRA